MTMIESVTVKAIAGEPGGPGVVSLPIPREVEPVVSVDGRQAQVVPVGFWPRSEQAPGEPRAVRRALVFFDHSAAHGEVALQVGGKPTASGQAFDPNALTAAHPTLPFGTLCVVTNLDNDLSVPVKITDRGPTVRGRIINVSSVVSTLGVPGTSAYAASKEGVIGLTRVIAKENASLGITANVLSLGYFDRGMIEQVPTKMLESIEAQIPMGHLGHPRSIVSAINFLIEAEYVTGAVIPINGGLA